MDVPPQKNLRILCFGDSLTAGYTMMGYAHYTYSEVLEGVLERFFPSTRITIDISGLSGDQVVGPSSMFLRRMEGKTAKAAAERAPYDWVIVLGGTNDIARFETPEDIYDGLSKFYPLLTMIYVGHRHQQKWIWVVCMLHAYILLARLDSISNHGKLIFQSRSHVGDSS